MNERRGFRVLVFLAAFTCLMFELIISRLADFHLDSRNSFIAIPITFLGLALGSLHVHFRRQIAERFRVGRSLVLLALVSVCTLTLVFFIFSRYLTVVGAYSIMGDLERTVLKSAFFVGVFLFPFYWFGRTLTACYYLNRDQIGAIYSADFFGASLACFATPFLFHALNLPGVLLTFTAALSLLLFLFVRYSWRGKLVVLALLIAANAAFMGLLTYADNHTNYQDFFSGKERKDCEEIAHAWNEFSRVSLLRVKRANGTPFFVIMHDNAKSNVNVVPYRPGVVRKARHTGVLESLFLLGRPIDEVMVMFAGCGAQMIPFHEFSGGTSHITGIELNPLVRDLAVETPELVDYRLKEFLTLPNIDLKIMEGRSFLVQDTRKYDVIFVGSKAQTNVQLTGHSRKYLDTVEAYGLYLDRLKDNGILYFNHQPLVDVVLTLRKLFEQRKLPPFEKSSILIRRGTSLDLMVSPRGFTREEVLRLVKADTLKPPRLLYGPYLRESTRGFAASITAPFAPGYRPITDDRPFVWDLSLLDYSLAPDMDRIRDELYFFNWTRITTLLGLGTFACLFILVACVPKTRRPPAATLVYLLITGFCYLLIEVTYMAKLELFLQDLLISMATTLTVFLLASGTGSLLAARLGPRLNMRRFPFLVAMIVVVSIVLLDFVQRELLFLPLAARILLVVVLVLPTGISLGMFYPFAVSALVKRGYEHAVPITYGISTLSSVIGATYAMTMMIESGFDSLLQQAAAGYLLLGLFVLLYSRFSRSNVLSLRV
ncbi:MAG: hypothetical protein HYV26_18085 [Candidatus Hydrogenedentes bacterium]|nr:hypothetical protein [Candidatus Hydrogenedentota bacterium]